MQKNSFLLILIASIVVTAAITFFIASKYVQDQDSKVADLSNGSAEGVTDFNPDLSPGASNEDEIIVVEHVRGNVDAPVTIVEFSDFQCPYCARFHETAKKIVDDYRGEVNWIYKHFPLDSIHPYARKAAEASECAAEQDKFWEYTDGVFEQQAQINPTFLKDLAKDIGLDANTFDTCLDSNKYASKVEADYQEGIKAGVRGTPGGFINDQPLGGAIPYDQLKSIIDSLL